MQTYDQTITQIFNIPDLKTYFFNNTDESINIKNVSVPAVLLTIITPSVWLSQHSGHTWSLLFTYNFPFPVILISSIASFDQYPLSFQIIPPPPASKITQGHRGHQSTDSTISNHFSLFLHLNSSSLICSHGPSIIESYSPYLVRQLLNCCLQCILSPWNLP